MSYSNYSNLNAIWITLSISGHVLCILMCVQWSFWLCRLLFDGVRLRKSHWYSTYTHTHNHYHQHKFNMFHIAIENKYSWDDLMKMNFDTFPNLGYIHYHKHWFRAVRKVPCFLLLTHALWMVQTCFCCCCCWRLVLTSKLCAIPYAVRIFICVRYLTLYRTLIIIILFSGKLVFFIHLHIDA